MDRMDTSYPLVSCIMPTYNRRRFVPQAVRGFLRQDYPNLELLVVDDGTDPIDDCLPNDPRIRYVRLNEKRTIGGKRNLACAEARGEFIVHWDDDDWYPPGRARVQLRALIDRAADVSGSSQLFYYEPATGQAWRYAYTAWDGPWVAGSTLAYRKSFWRRNHFLDIQVGEDSQFVWSAVEKVVYDLADPALCVGIIHANNTSYKERAGLCWYPQSSQEVEALLGQDLHFYQMRRASP